MRMIKDMLRTRLLPDVRKDADREEWLRHGGKLIILDRIYRIVPR